MRFGIAGATSSRDSLFSISTAWPLGPTSTATESVADIYKKVRGSFPNLGRYQKVRVVTLSGLDLGIASLDLKYG
jgi:hypothetical protein